MSTSVFSPSAYPAQPLVAPRPPEGVAHTATPLPSSGTGRDMVRGLALMWVAAAMAGLVLLTERLLLDRMNLGDVLGGLVLWAVLLSALLLLSRVSVRLSVAMLSWLDRSALALARERSRTRWGVASH